ncbi:MAG: cbb3-type cytochrome oxidase assembly protein CcoS [Aureibaculum sp.]|nr:cbb3-type cytochrome oxidase assembly protein CcoS [Aureibaculum sp.]
MNIVLFMIIVSLFIAIIFFILFIKSVKSGQYDDLYTPSVRMLFDDEIIEEKDDSLQDTKSTNQINNE